MSMKKTDLVKHLAKKIDGQMKGVAVPGRFGQAASVAVDKREQRRLDTQAGLLPFACKLPTFACCKSPATSAFETRLRPRFFMVAPS